MRTGSLAAAVLALLAPGTASAQPYAPRDVYGNLLSVPRYGYPPGYPADGYSDNFPLATRPASRPRARAVDPMTGYAYGGPPVYEPEDEGFDYAISPEYERQFVSYRGERTARHDHHRYTGEISLSCQPGGRAIRYGIGVGRPGFEWAGRKSVTMKREWPDWRPPPEMLQPPARPSAYMEGGPDNPLGARALYLGSSLYRIHGTNEPHTIGQAVSSGCIRMLNRDVIDLYRRVPVGAQVVVI